MAERGSPLGDDWVVITDEERSLGIVQVNVQVPKPGQDRLVTERTTFAVDALALRRGAIGRWQFSSSDAYAVLCDAHPRGLNLPPNDTKTLREHLAANGNHCTGQMRYNRSMGKVVVALFDYLQGSPHPSYPTKAGFVEYSFGYRPPRTRAYVIMERFWNARNL